MRWNARYGLGATALSEGPKRAQRRDRLLAGLDAAEVAEHDRADAAQAGAQQHPAAHLIRRLRHEAPIICGAGRNGPRRQVRPGQTPSRDRKR
jgi:hypothetical protein